MRSEVEEVEGWLASLAFDPLRQQSRDPSAPFLGLHEIADASARLTAEIMRQCNLSLPADIVDRYPSPHLLAEWMCRNADRIYDPIIRFRDSEPSPDTSDILFCVHPVSGVGTVFKGLGRYLRPRFQTFALQARGFNPGETPPPSFGEMVSLYADRITDISGSTAPHLLGWSFGGHIAQAIAIELQRRGHQTGLLMLVDSWISEEASAEAPPTLPNYEEYLRERYALLLPERLDDFDGMDDEARLRGFIDCLVELDALTEKASQIPYPAMRRLAHVAHRLDAMYRRSLPPSYSSPTILARAADNANWGVDVVAQWTPIASDLTVVESSHPHPALLVRDDSIKALAAAVDHYCTAFARRNRPSIV